ncbi:MAG: DUF6114 domain-containing protein, partial [Actinomycetes bacterium]
VFLIGSGLVMLVPTCGTVRLDDFAISITLGGASALIISVMQIVIGISIWIRPQFRTPAGIAAGLLALVSLPAANLGGLIIGMRLGLVGAALAISWNDRPKARVLLLVALIGCAMLGSGPAPTAAAPLVGQARGPKHDCPPPVSGSMHRDWNYARSILPTATRSCQYRPGRAASGR